MHRQNCISKSTKRRRLLEATANILEHIAEVPSLTSPISTFVSNVTINDNSSDTDSNINSRDKYFKIYQY